MHHFQNNLTFLFLHFRAKVVHDFDLKSDLVGFFSSMIDVGKGKIKTCDILLKY